MKRLRAMFLGLSVVLLLALVLLVGSALESVDAERELRHRAIAERIFDEMERELTAFLRREEDRPFEHYRTYYASAAPGSEPLQRSPLAEPPDRPFLVGYFQVEPDGSVTTPVEDEELARTVEVLLASETGHFFGIRREPSQAPGTTEPVAASRRDSKEEDRGYLDELSELNRGAVAREQRAAKLVQSAASNVYLKRKEEGSAENEAVDVVLDSIAGRRTDDRHLVLYREARSGGATYRQGFLVDVEALVTWLEERVLAGTELSSRARVAVSQSDEPRAVTEGFQFSHQFGEPFGEAAALVTIAPLPEGGGASYIYLLSLLASLAATAGLFGLYRTVSVAWSFAERRQNFVSAVSHELKTPLTAIRMYGEMLRDGLVASSEKRQQYYEVITAESERLTRLVNNVLELSKLERRSRALHLVAGPVEKVFEEVVEVLGPHARHEGFLLRIDCEKDLPDALYDRDALLQVLFNLVDNAVKYSKGKGAGEIRLEARRGDGAVVLAVADEGPGVSEAHLKRIFEPFYRAESELTRTSKGAGIGLALVRGLVQAMGGTVEGRNVEGGFRVSVSLPLAGGA
jgi:signal transduction histidine kinase